ncbi:restriction endonuclease subunit S [Aquisalimonas asiatica]|uniref:Type I restriction enzyme, S subunit n=1 Tax=Aquisalimonas asiatica TaxID=406100 RepID=A0A1H8VVX0_9GAMM|nr:restriction endonuclease subunit S [Aquisalimonas asiatica]SEP19505.1 type I restriction enzyme, S subunit [Aquisalimonas asiatica]
MSFSSYPEYKDSGVEWLGEVPAHWYVCRLRHAATLNPSKSAVRGLPEDTPVTFLPMDAVGQDGSLDLAVQRALGEVVDGYTYVRDGDVAYAKITPCFENGKSALIRGTWNGIAFGTTELTVLRPVPRKANPDYLFRVISSEPFRALGEASMYGAGGQKRVPDDFARDFTIAWPPLAEQRVIARFLDHETARIDALIAEQQRLIELLKEKRQAVISHAVTKGLDPDVPMKDSGVEWLGEVPEHWVVAQLRYKGRLESGHTPSRSNPDFWVNCTIPWFTLSDVWQIRFGGKRYVYDTTEMINDEGLRGSSARLLPAGSVILSRTASVGFPAILGKEMAVSQDFAVWVCGNEVDSQFLWFALLGMRKDLKRLMMGSTHQTIYMPDLKYLKAAFPPMSEQGRIVNYLDTAVEEMEKMESQAHAGIGLLRERRSALISAAVTGKIDVRDWQPPTSETFAEATVSEGAPA